MKSKKIFSKITDSLILLLLVSVLSGFKTSEGADLRFSDSFLFEVVLKEDNAEGKIKSRANTYHLSEVKQDSFEIKISKKTSDYELQQLKEDLKNKFGIDFNYVISRNKNNEISILSLNYTQNGNNGSYQVSEEKGIDHFYFFIDSSGKIGIWSEVMENRKKMQMDRKNEMLEHRDQQVAEYTNDGNWKERRKKIEARLQRQKERMNERREQMRDNYDNIETSSKSNSFTDPLYILDGRQISKEEMLEMSPADILDVNVIKNEEAIKKFGGTGLNGAIIITSKKEE